MERIKHPVDDLFKEALQGHQVKPSDAARKRFLDEAATIKINGKRSRSRWLLLLGGLVIVTSAVMVLWLHQDSPQSAVRSPQSAVSSSQSAVRSSRSDVVNESGITDHNRHSSLNVNPASPSSGGKTPPLSSYATSSASTPSSPNIPSSLNVLPPTSIVQRPSSNVPYRSYVLRPTSNVPYTSYVLRPTSNIPSSASEGSDSATLTFAIPNDHVTAPAISTILSDSIVGFPSTVQIKDTVSSTDPLYTPDKSKKKNRYSDWQFATSVYYAPEWMFNTLEGDKFVSNLGLEESFVFGRYVLRTGLGLSIAKGTNELMVEYNDYLGSYYHLDSISFAWDEKHYHLLPTYYLSDKDVWDSLLRLDYPKVIKRYTYLQIPLILGYNVLQKNRVSLGFRAGPILSVLLQSKQLSEEYDPGKNRVVQINQVTPDRIATNWQLMGGINVSWHISKQFGLELEPNVKYYFNSVYEKSDATKKPWSVGFRASFSIRYQ